jgi:hypothetical protein
MRGPIRAAVVGGHRGGGYRRAPSVLPEQVTLPDFSRSRSRSRSTR